MDLVRRRLRRDELPLAWTIDRREIVERVFDLRDGQLVSRPDPFDIRGWPPGDPEKLAPIFEATLDRGGAFLGLGSTCSPGACAPVTGVCCTLGGCQVQSVSECALSARWSRLPPARPGFRAL